MRRVVALVLATTAMLAASIAAADTKVPPIAIAVNAPSSWADGSAYAGTGYVGLGKRHGVRINLASYAYTDTMPGLVAALGANGIETDYSGRIRDVSVGWQYFSRRLWDGWSIELDALVRSRDTRLDESFWASSIRDHDTTTYAGRLMVGRSWLIADRVFIALSLGLSRGLEKGTETTWRVDDVGNMTTEFSTKRVNRDVVSGEGFLRFGVAFGS
jgi:hypothetical protein